MGIELIKELQSREEIIEAFPIMQQLRTHLNENTYLELVMDAKKMVIIVWLYLRDYSEQMHIGFMKIKWIMTK